MNCYIIPLIFHFSHEYCLQDCEPIMNVSVIWMTNNQAIGACYVARRHPYMCL